MFEHYKEKLKMSFERLYVRFISHHESVSDAVYDWHDTRLDNLNRRTFVILAIGLIFVSVLYVESFHPTDDFPIEQYITIEEGETLQSLAQVLEDEDIVRSAHWLEILVRLRGGQHSVHAGDYLFAKPVGAFSVARIITTGAYGLEPIKITIPEGATVADMAIIYDRRLFKFDADKFLRDTNDLEGYLFPDTYHFLPNVREDEVIRVMQDTFQSRIAEFEDDLAESEYSLHEIITLASIIEKEAWKPKDQKLISGVLHNRLDDGMRLQVDATFTYTHDKGTYDITLAELKDEENPYNTYVHKGLPPGPIAAVGESAISAALRPTPSSFYFYLADRTGTTYFSATYAEHLAKKRVYVD
ncbi:endolytic transglycosylase MltG [Candidatus Kaiserbacteria bacterium]|nr:MAG: endolytic transglycosylase MltG [Candidatus Kaiserbacteria bacterium]